MIRPANAALPRDFPGPHPEAAGSLADDAVAWIHARMGADPNAEAESLLWHQWLILQRALEVRGDGSLCWPLVLVTMPRQQGKTLLLAELALWRAAHRELFGERQRVLHAARNVGLANEVQAAARTWAAGQGLRVTKRVADSLVEWPDGSHWHVKALAAVWGQRVSMALLDEGWDMSPDAFWQGLWPAMAERRARQAWVFSAANVGDRGLLGSLGSMRGVLVASWGARPGDDPLDEGVWAAATPFMSGGRLEAMRLAAGAPGFEVEWLNVGVGASLSTVAALPGWAELPVAGPEPPRGGVVAVDESRDGARIGVLRLLDQRVWYREVTDLAEAARVADTADRVVVGLSMVEPLAKAGMRASAVRMGVRELRMFTPLLQQAVASGRLAHDHGEAMNAQAVGARLVESEAGRTLSAKRSEDDILSVKLLAWALGFERGNDAPLRARIF